MGKRSKNRLDRVYTENGKSIYVGNIDACCQKDLQKHGTDAVVCIKSRKKIKIHKVPVLMEKKMAKEIISCSSSSSSTPTTTSSSFVFGSDSNSNSDSNSDSSSDSSSSSSLRSVSDDANFCLNREYKNGKVIFTPITCQIGISDSESANIGQYLDSVSRFIRDALRFTNVLVHCNQGKCRSATMVAAYLIRYHGMTVSQAHRVLKRKRSFIHIRKEFIKQLEKFESKVRKRRNSF